MKPTVILVVAANVATPLPALAFAVAPLKVESPAIPIKKGKGHGDHDERFEHRRHHDRHHSHRHHRHHRGWHHSGQHGGGHNQNQPNGQN